jgi:hypothetical protein
MFRKKIILKYESAIETYPDVITPAKKHIPEWYKKIPIWKNNEIYEIDKGFNKSIKLCPPFLDCFTSGYMIVLPNDLYIKNDNGFPLITWSNAEYPPKLRTELTDLNLVPTGHHELEFAWQTGAANTIPIGYSMLYTHPLNRHDLPFTTLSGIIDGGFCIYPNGEVPFFIKKGFEGIIPQGTPIVQLIPFRQEKWKHKKTKNLIIESKKHWSKSTAMIYGWYKKTFWTKKQYN